MRTYLASLVLVLASACAASRSAAPSAHSPTPARAIETPSATATPPPAPSAYVNAAPDVPSGAAAARDAELAKIASAVLETFSNNEPVLTRDGEQLVFVSNRDGLPQLYLADAAKPESPATHLVTS